MKLHLPCALRGALLASFALALTTPAWAEDTSPLVGYVWSGDGNAKNACFIENYTPTAGETQSVLDISMENADTGKDKYFIRARDQGDTSGSSCQAPALSATISSFTVYEPATYEITAQWQNNFSFNGLTFLSIDAHKSNGETDSTWLDDSSKHATLAIGSTNVINLGLLDGSGAMPLASDKIQFTINGTLNVNLNHFIGTKTGTGDAATFAGGIADNITGGSGTLALWGEVDWSLGDDTVLWDASKSDATGFTFANVDISNLTLKDAMPLGSRAVFTWEDSKLMVTAETLGVGCTVKTEGAAPDGTVTMPDFSTVDTDITLDSGCQSFVGVTADELADASAAWQLKLYGTLTNPYAGDTPASIDSILVSTTNTLADGTEIGTTALSADGAPTVDLADGNFAIFVTPEGKIVMHKSGEMKEMTDSPSGDLTSFCIGQLPEEWTTMTFNLSLQFTQAGDVWMLKYTPTEGNIALADGYGNALSTDGVMRSNLAYIYLGAALASDAMQNLYTRLPEYSATSMLTQSEQLPVTVIKKVATWYIYSESDGSTTTVEALQRGEYNDYDSGESFMMTAGDTIVFGSGILGTETEGATVEISNTVQVADGAVVNLAPAAGGTMHFSDSSSWEILNTGYTGTGNRLNIMGGAGSTVKLSGFGSGMTYDLAGISIAANNTLEMEGPATINIDATANAFDAAANFSMVGGNLNFSGATDAASAIGKLSNTTGTVTIKNKVAAQQLEGKNVTIFSGAEATASEVTSTNLLTLQANAQLTADTLNVKNIGMNSGTNLTVSGELNASSISAYMATGNITAGSITTSTGGVELGDYYGTANTNRLVADTLSVADQLTMYTGAEATTSTSATAKSAYIKGAKLNIGAGSLDIAEGTTMTGSNAAINGQAITVATNGDETAEIQALHMEAASLSCASISNALITYDKALLPATRSRAATPADFSFDMAEATNTPISGTGSVEIIGTELTDSPITVTDGSLLLNGTTHSNSSATITNGTAELVDTTMDATSSITITSTDGQTTPALTLTNAGFDEGATLTIGTSAYTVTNVNSVTLTTEENGATQDGITLTEVDVNLRNVSYAGTVDVLVAAAGDGEVIMNPATCAITLHFAPGMDGTLMDDPESDNLIIRMEDVSEGILAEITESSNTAAAAEALMAGNAAAAGPGSVLADLYNFIRDTDQNTEAERRTVLNQMSTGSITMLADSQRRGVTNTINSLRNRIIQMGNPHDVESETHLHAWIEADGSYNDIDQDGGCAGYEYQTWGGTVGVHADVGNYSFGAAISAAYGELTAHSEDRAEGNNDSITFSAFARHQHKRWTQMGILSFGMNDMDMERSVNQYKGSGDTEGHTITAYYEAGYTFVMNESGSQVLQPLVSLMLTSASVDSLTEDGSIGDAGLCSSDEDYFYGTVGIGARYQLVLAEDVNARLSFLELRAKLVQDFGDETNETTVHFAGLPGQGFTVQGADVGRTGFQFGAGLSVPMGMYTTMFADVDADIRSGATSVSGSVGVRVEF